MEHHPKLFERKSFEIVMTSSEYDEDADDLHMCESTHTCTGNSHDVRRLCIQNPQKLQCVDEAIHVTCAYRYDAYVLGNAVLFDDELRQECAFW